MSWGDPWSTAAWTTLPLDGGTITYTNCWPVAHVCHHAATACVQVGRRHCEVRCLDCAAALARYRFEPDTAPVVLREPPPAADVPRAPTTHRIATQRWHRASPRRFQGASA